MKEQNLRLAICWWKKTYEGVKNGNSSEKKVKYRYLSRIYRERQSFFGTVVKPQLSSPTVVFATTVVSILVFKMALRLP